MVAEWVRKEGRGNEGGAGQMEEASPEGWTSFSLQETSLLFKTPLPTELLQYTPSSRIFFHRYVLRGDKPINNFSLTFVQVTMSKGITLLSNGKTKKGEKQENNVIGELRRAEINKQLYQPRVFENFQRLETFLKIAGNLCFFLYKMSLRTKFSNVKIIFRISSP